MTQPPPSPASQAFLVDVQQRAPDVRIKTSPMDRWGYARDASPEGFLERRAGVVAAGPAAILWPASDVDVSTILKLAGQHGVPVSPYGAGSGVVHGLEPGPHSVVVDLKRFDSVEIDAAKREATVGAGVIGERMERALNAAGFSAGHFPSSIYCSSVGGWAAARSAGQLSSRYGKIEDMVLSLDAVDGAGRLIHAGKNDAVDLLRMLIGSEGTLAIITRITLRIQPLATHRVLFGLAAPSVDAGLSLMSNVMQSGLRPAVFRMYDPPDTALAGGIPAHSAQPVVVSGCLSRAGHEDPFMKGPSNAPHSKGLFDLLTHRAKAAARKASSSDALRDVVSTALSHTGWLQVPYRLLPAHCLMVVGLEGTFDDVTESLEATLGLAQEAGVTMVGAAPGERWLKRRHAVTYKMPPFLNAGGWADTLEVSAPWSTLGTLYTKARTAMLDHAVTLAHFSHAYPDGASIYFTLAGGHVGLEEQRRSHRAAVDAAMAAVISLGAAPSHHHGVGRLKSPRLLASFGPGAKDALQGLKRSLDPHNILNPGALGLAP